MTLLSRREVIDWFKDSMELYKLFYWPEIVGKDSGSCFNYCVCVLSTSIFDLTKQLPSNHVA
jgi:hypothetical protein